MSNNDEFGLSLSYRRPPSLTAVGVALLVVIVVLGLLPGPGPLDTQNPPPTILGLIWNWLKANKDSIAPLSQLITSCGVVVAAITFLRTQRINRSEWFFKVLKEVTDKLKDIRITGYTDDKILEVIIFYSVLFSYYHYRLVGQRENGLSLKETCLNLFEIKECKSGWSPEQSNEPRFHQSEISMISSSPTSGIYNHVVCDDPHYEQGVAACLYSQT